MKALKYIGIIILSWVVIHSIVIVADGLTDNPIKADCILILGNTVNVDGTPSKRLQSRLDKGADLYKNHYAERIIVSGGKGKEGHYEGTVMKLYLIQQGIDETHIIVDNLGINTLETANNFVKIADTETYKSVIVVSQFFHLTRTKFILKKKGVNKVYAAHANYFELRDAYATLRETIAFYKYLWL